MECLPADACLPDFQGSTLILPAVSAGNVGQLAVDALITRSALERVAYLEDPRVLPCAGNDPYAGPQGAIVTSLELYGPSRTVFALQQRGGVALGCQVTFATSLVSWAQQQRFKQVVLLASMDAAERRSPQPANASTRYLALSNAAQSDCQSLGLVQLEDPAPTEKPYLERLSGAWPLLQQCVALHVPAVAFLHWVTEGDNTTDALQLADTAMRYLQLPTPVHSHKEGQVPESWRYSYGRRAVESAY